MKLIDLLVQELPKRGGWPEGADCCCLSGVDSDGVTIQFRFIPRRNEFLFIPDYDHLDIPYKGDATEFITCGVITKEVYQYSLAASKKPAWNGEGVPPVGCECECHVDEGIIHCIVVGYDFDGKAVVMRNVPARKYFSIQANSGRIKPLRTEAERKREAAVKVIKGLLMFDYGDDPRINDATFIYDAIAAGKIPGVKLED